MRHLLGLEASGRAKRRPTFARLARALEYSPKDFLRLLARKMGHAVGLPRVHPPGEAFLRSAEYRDLMMRYVPCTGEYGLHEAQTYTRSYVFRHRDSLGRLGVFRWRGLFERLDTVLDELTAPGVRIIDFGGAGCPLGFGSVVVDVLKSDAAGHPVQFHRLSDLGEQFDVLFACHVFEHIADLRGALEEIRQGLREGGAVVCLVPSFTNEDWRAGPHANPVFGAHMWTFGLAASTPPPSTKAWLNIDDLLAEYFAVVEAAYVGDDSIFCLCRKPRG